MQQALGELGAGLLVEGSPGQGNWAAVPWISVFDPAITTSATRGYYVVYPVDCLPSESAFREAYAAWHMAGGGPPVTTKWVTVTRSDMIKFENANH